jgi:4-hydroxybenzoate polyprenyltransferase
MKPAQLLKISRPRFWIYTVGPFLVALAAAGVLPPVSVILLGLYLTLPANLLIYGVNDTYDYETDKLNPKKQSYESLLMRSSTRSLTKAILLLNLPFIVVLLFLLPINAWFWLAVFIFTGVGYSMPPIRAKARPVIDMVFNILYVAPAFAAYTALTGSLPPAPVMIASLLWCMAMHAYSAVPDIAADIASKTPTVATLLGRQKTLLFCGAAYVAAAIISWQYIAWLAIVSGLVYAVMIAASLRTTSDEDLFALYKRFPLINTLLGAALFFTVALTS